LSRFVERLTHSAHRLLVLGTHAPQCLLELLDLILRPQKFDVLCLEQYLGRVLERGG
jgi:hypothetical protein